MIEINGREYSWEEMDKKNKYILRKSPDWKTHECYRHRVFVLLDGAGNPTNSIRRRTGNFIVMFLDDRI